KADQGTHGEDWACGRDVGLKFALKVEQLRLGQSGNARRHGEGDRPLHGGRIAPRGQPDDTELDIRRTAARVWEQFRKSTISDHDGAIVLEVGAEGKASDNFDLTAV